MAEAVVNSSAGQATGGDSLMHQRAVPGPGLKLLLGEGMGSVPRTCSYSYIMQELLSCRWLHSAISLLESSFCLLIMSCTSASFMTVSMSLQPRPHSGLGMSC